MSNEESRRKTGIQAKVFSDKMEKACVVLVEHTVTHSKYSKKMKKSKKLIVRADDSVKVGDLVSIVPSRRPLSKRIHFQVSQVLKAI